MALFVRLMVIKQRAGWGYETLMREVSDSLHLRRFCGLSLTASLPHESTIRKLVRRLGAEVVDDITRALIAKAQRERRFTARAMRCDSTVVEADVRWPSDAALALDGARRLAREGARVAAVLGDGARRVQNRSRAVGRRLRLIGRTVGRRLGRTGGARAKVLELTGQTGELVRRSLREARALAAQARRRARGRGAQAKLAAARRWSSRPTWPRRSAGRSRNGSPARRSPTGSSRSPTPTRGRSARASSASATSSATSSSSPS